MALVHATSCECGKSELDLFTLPPTQTAIESTQSIEYRPISTLSDASPVEFFIAGSADEYIDLSETYMKVTVKITKLNGDDLQTKLEDDTFGTEKGVGPVNNFLHSLFSQVDMDLNGVLTTASTNTYPYRAYLENLLSYGRDANNSQLELCMWYKDTGGTMEDTEDENKGFVSRRKRIENSAKVNRR